MRSGQYTGILHMRLEVPELLQAHARNVNDVRRADNWRFGVRPWQRTTERCDELRHVLVQGEKAK